MLNSIFNYSNRKVGGIRFIRIGRLQFSFCVCRSVPRTFEWDGEILVGPDGNGNSMVVGRDC